MDYETIHDAYLGVLAEIVDNPDCISAPRGMPIREKIDYIFTVLKPVSEPIKTRDHERNKVIASYTAKEFEVYQSLTRDSLEFVKLSKFWGPISNPDGTTNSAYGWLIWKDCSCGDSRFSQEKLTPWEWARRSLIVDRDTRQAILKFHKREHLWFGNKDQVCTLHAMFLIRSGALNLTIVMRSNDLFFGTVYDCPFFIFLLEKMRSELLTSYPGLKVGKYCHFTHSLHVYERNLAAIRKILGR